MLDIPNGYSIPGYTFAELVTKKEESFLHTSYQTFWVFNEEGEMGSNDIIGELENYAYNLVSL